MRVPGLPRDAAQPRQPRTTDRAAARHKMYRKRGKRKLMAQLDQSRQIRQNRQQAQ